MPHLTLSQRYQIWRLRHLKPAEIARRIGKHRSVVTRELARNGPTRQAYQPQLAHKRAAQRKKANAVKTIPLVCQTIAQGLANQWSPDQIKGRCQQQGQPMLSRAAIYAHIWRDQRQGGQLYKDLRHANRPYRKRYGKPDGRGKAARRAAKPSIDQRPAVVAEKSRFGDWELDTVLGPQQKGVLVTITERSSNYLLMQRVDDKSAAQTRQAVIDSLSQSGLPVHTLTSDNGTEFADYEQIAKALKTSFYFAHPYHAWERGANEHNNKLIRQYLPKKQDFSQMSPQQITTYQDRLNDRPRKKLNYSTRNKHLKSLFSTQFVAFQT
ncbi:IS30-like element IS1655 family transposase [Hymenobacter fastidiosus]|uniref:IS30-like element IS1655 family transposase n=1 Tax=Hymenobacter fastidiosus TaxID=486264 RepID=A0ABP7SRA0_9BACT